MVFKNKKAKEIIYQNAKNWINSQPLSLEKLQGKVVLIDFWAYSCINCIRTFESLKKIWEKYKNKRFVLIGIHTPEFEFEKEMGNLKYAIKKYGLDYPILSDPERINWDNYGNKHWPRIALIDAEGNIILEHVGESGYVDIDQRIIIELKKLRELSQDYSEIIEEENKSYPLSITQEVYAGSLRNEKIEYVDNHKYEQGIIYLQGEWKQEPEYLEFKGKEGYIILKFYASEANVVLSGIGETEVLLNEFPIDQEDSGKDIIKRDNKTYIKLEGPDMQSIVKSSDFHLGLLKIKAIPNMKVYAYTFG